MPEQDPIAPPGLRFDLADREETVAGRVFTLRALVDFEAAVDQISRTVRGPDEARWFGELCPMFGVVWPSARALAGLVAERVTRQDAVLELGCGLALPSLVAAGLGARVLATDQHPDAEGFLAHNAARNGLVVPFARFGWADEALPPGVAEGAWTAVIASDVLYDQAMPELLAAAFARFLAPGGVGWVTDPGRPHLHAFTVAAAARGLRVGLDVRDDVFLVEVRAWAP